MMNFEFQNKTIQHRQGKRGESESEVLTALPAALGSKGVPPPWRPSVYRHLVILASSYIHNHCAHITHEFNFNLARTEYKWVYLTIAYAKKDSLWLFVQLGKPAKKAVPAVILAVSCIHN